MYNVNTRLITDEFENEFEERVATVPQTYRFEQSSISNFFSTNMIDIPRCLQKSYSLYKPIFTTPHLKFLNIIMRHGCKEQIFASVFKIFIKHYLHPNDMRMSN